MAKKYRLQYFGGFGMGLKFGDVRDFPEKEAKQLLRDWPRHFKVVKVFDEEPKENAVESRSNKKAKIRNRKKADKEESDE